MCARKASKANKKTPSKDTASGGALSSGGHRVASLGTLTEKIMRKYFQKDDQTGLFDKIEDSGLYDIGESLKGWSDMKAADIMELYADSIKRGVKIDNASLCKWIAAHVDDPEAIADCINVCPPDDIEIMRRLPKTGSQKIVFIATWSLAQSTVVLKKVLVEEHVLAREKITSGFKIDHPKIIDTRFVKNDAGEEFLIEEYLSDILNDDWNSGGNLEAVNLLYDLADALTHLHNDISWIHGDVKPDNIGKRGNNYVLLDFGIARPLDEFDASITATGSIRTRAPELLTSDKYEHPEKVDIWALGATVFNAILGRFPLFKQGEEIPRVSDPQKRKKYEELLAKRVLYEYDDWVDLKSIEDPLGSILSRTLAKEPTNRLNARQLVNICEEQLSVYLRSRSDLGRFLPKQELEQILNYLPGNEGVQLMPLARKKLLKDKLNKLSKIPDLSADYESKINKIIELLEKNA